MREWIVRAGEVKAPPAPASQLSPVHAEGTRNPVYENGTVPTFASIEVLLSNMTYWDGNRPATRLTFWLDNRNQKLFGASTKIYQTDDFVRAWHFTQESTSGEYISPFQNDTIAKAKEHKQEATHISYKTLKLSFITSFYFHWKIYLLQIFIYFVVHPQRIERESTSVLMSRHVFSLLVSIINHFISYWFGRAAYHISCWLNS